MEKVNSDSRMLKIGLGLVSNVGIGDGVMIHEWSREGKKFVFLGFGL